MNESQRHAHRLYLHPRRGWVPEPEDALMRLDAQTRTRAIAEARNQILRPDGRGGWTALPDEEGLSPRERGLVWFGWQTMARGRPYLAFKGVRVLDKPIIEELLHGLTVRDENGAVLPEPLAAGHIFLLTVDDAKEFNKRVRLAKGEIQRGDPVPAAATESLQWIERAGEALEALAAQDAETLVEAEEAIFVGSNAFERRHEQFADQLQLAQHAFAECKRTLRALEAPGRSLAEQAEAEALRQRAQHALERCQTLHEQRELAERELARLTARASGRLPSESNPAAQMLLFRELGRIAAAQGLEVEESEVGVRVRTRYGWLRLGPGFAFEGEGS